MRNELLRELTAIVEGKNPITAPVDKTVQSRQTVQSAFDALTGLLPQLHARVSSLAPRVIGPTVSAEDAGAVDRIGQEIADLAQQVSTQVDKLRKAVDRHRTTLED